MFKYFAIFREEIKAVTNSANVMKIFFVLQLYKKGFISNKFYSLKLCKGDVIVSLRQTFTLQQYHI